MPFRSCGPRAPPRDPVTADFTPSIGGAATTLEGVILAVDTSLGTAVALLGADGVIAEAAHAQSRGHAEVIGDLLREVVAGRKVTHVVAGMGPGPFTGLRIGIAAARAFALGRGIPVVPVPSHFAPALAHLESHAGPVTIVTDARRREVAVSIFDGLDADGLPAGAAPVLVPRAEVSEFLAGMRSIEVGELAASDLARVAARALAVGRTLAGPEPLYLRAPDAQPRLTHGGA